MTIDFKVFKVAFAKEGAELKRDLDIIARMPSLQCQFALVSESIQHSATHLRRSISSGAPKFADVASEYDSMLLECFQMSPYTERPLRSRRLAFLAPIWKASRCTHGAMPQMKHRSLATATLSFPFLGSMDQGRLPLPPPASNAIPGATGFHTLAHWLSPPHARLCSWLQGGPTSDGRARSLSTYPAHPDG